MVAASWTTSDAYNVGFGELLDAEARRCSPRAPATPVTSSLSGPGSPASSVLQFADIYRRFLGHVGRWVRALGGPEADREDLIQDVFLIVHRRLHTFDGRNVAGWLYRITRHRVRDFRQLCWVRFFIAGLPPDDSQVSPTEGPEGELCNKEKRRLLTKLLGHLTDSQRTTFVLFEIEGYTSEEIAVLHDVCVNTVRARIHRARTKLVAELKRLPERP
jgi:RNA polymerase sigma-70 factor (ECF subfamily)